MLNSPIVSFAAVAFLSSAICNASDAGYTASNNPTDSSDSTHSDPTSTSNSTRPAPVMIEDFATNKRRFGANAFIGSAVRSDQQAVFKSLIDDVSIIGSFVQTKVLDSHNFGFPIEGPNYVQIKSGDSRTKTFFDSPSSGFVSSNDGITKEAYDSKPENMLFDRGGFSVSFNLDSKKLNGTHVILSWTDQIIGMDYAPHADSFLVYIGTPGNMTEAKQLAINETITSDHHTGNYMQGNSTQMFKSSGLNKRAIDMSSFMDKKIVMEFVVADQGDQVVDVACALDDFHWQSMDGMGYHQMHARGGIPGLDSIPGLGGATSGLTDGLPVISGLTGGSGSGSGGLPLKRRSEDQQYNNQNNYQQSDNNYRPNGQYQGGQQQNHNSAGFIPPFAEQFIPEGVRHILRRDQDDQYQGQSRYNNPNSQSDSYNSQQQNGAGFIPPFAEQFIPEGVRHIIRRDQYHQYQGQSQPDSYNSQQQNGAGFIPPFAEQFIPEGVRHIIKRSYDDNNQYSSQSQSGSYNSPQQNGPGFIPPFAEQFIPEGVRHIIRRDQYNQYQGQSQPDSYNSQQQNGAGFIPPFAEQFIPEGVRHIIKRSYDDNNQYQGQSQYNNPNSQSDSYNSQQQNGPGFIPPFAEQFIPEGVRHIIRRDGNDQYQGQSQYNNPNSPTQRHSNDQYQGQSQHNNPSSPTQRQSNDQYQGQSQSNNPNSPTQRQFNDQYQGSNNGYRHNDGNQDNGGSQFIPSFAQQFIPDGVKHIIRRSAGEYVQGQDMDGHHYGEGFHYGNSAGANGQNSQVSRDGQNGQGAQYGQNDQGAQNGQRGQISRDGQNGEQSSQYFSSPGGSNSPNPNLGQGQGYHSNGASSDRPQTPSYNGNQGGNVNDQNQRQTYTGGNSNGNTQSESQDQYQSSKGHYQQGGGHQTHEGSQFIPGFAEQFIPDGVKNIFRRSDEYVRGNDMDGHQNADAYSRGDHSSAQDGYSSSRQAHGGNTENGNQPTSSSESDQMPSEMSPNSQNRQNSNAPDASTHPSQSETMSNPNSPNGNTTSDQTSGTHSPSNSSSSSPISNIFGGSLGGQPAASDSPSDSSSTQTTNSSSPGTTSSPSNFKSTSNSTEGKPDSQTNGQSQSPEQMGGDEENQARPTTDRQGSTNSDGSNGYTHQSQKNDGTVESAPSDKGGYSHSDHSDDQLKRRQFIPAGVQALFQ
ncbi:hypothetical protein DFH28DRAFT_1050593 [Melampsora americana]|nr:hypothetical protein DFH28DRAFT_1050593 [Melampsora americana]